MKEKEKDLKTTEDLFKQDQLLEIGCQMRAHKRCEGIGARYVLKTHYGSKVVNCCFACWGTIGSD